MTSPGGHERAGVAGSLAGEVTESGVFGAVLDGYDAVYDALPRGETFSRLWRAHAYRGDFPEQFAHIGFLTFPRRSGCASCSRSGPAMCWRTWPAARAAPGCGWRRNPARR